ncbi:S-layer homology domain-containing protein [Sporosarcina sp. ANT_H38]|uniref:S-layer homology domain-containing protein n=1 Tax=Sporosarcina sp. ANT_H38 TaxID=2597358 RepID=UPI0011F0B1A8|nr:S-layer homology domain-containing protein [Sporosarcina sp. ANT_H38]KAA0955582.1 S-layer homology domain-containing protein [Sporosarcina sp. ANT_H38]
MEKLNYEKIFKAMLATTVAAGAFVAVAPMNTQAANPTFSDVKDIPSHHFYEAVMDFTARGMISGYPDGTFKPGKSITRQDAAKLLALALGLDTKNVQNPGFKDVSKTSPYYGHIAALVEAGIISGYVDNTFKPEASLSRAQMAKMIVLGFEFNETKTVKLPFSDINDKQWHAEFVQELYANEITTGTTPTKFSPNAVVTRGQMASFVFRSEAIVTPKPEPVDVDKVAVEAAVSQLKDGAVTVSRGNDATDATKLAAVQAYITSLITENGVVAKVAASTTAGNYVVTLTKGEAKVDKTIAITFGFAADDRFVTEVTAINAKQVEVKFATPVTKTTILNATNEVQNIAFTMVSGATVNPGQLKGSLSEDGKTLTITANWVFDGEYAFKSTAAIKSETGEKFDEYTAIVKANDKVAPKLVSGSAAAKTSTNSFALLFDEPVNAAGVIAYVNNGAATVANNPTNPNRLDVTSSKQVAAGTTATVKLVNVKDYNNNLTTPNSVETAVTISADTIAPIVLNAKVIGENRVEITYDKNMNIASFKGRARLVHSNGTVTNLVASAGANEKTVILTGAGLAFNNAYNVILFVDADAKDTVGNSTALYSTNVTFEKDNSAPALTTIDYKDGKIVANFTEDIAIGRNTIATAIDQKTGIATQINLNYYNSQNAVIANNTLTIAHSLPNGNYQLRLPANTVVDKAGTPNPNAIATQTFSVQNAISSDQSRPVVVAVTNSPVGNGQAVGVEQTATYTAIDTDSGVNLTTVQDISNYTWDGKALPVGSYVTTVITGSADKATSVAVSVRVPSAGIQTTKTAPFTVNNIRDNAGNTIASAEMGTVTFVSGNQYQPELRYGTINTGGTSLTLSFSEAIQSLDANDFEVTLNNATLKTSSIASVYNSNSNMDTFVVSIRASVANNTYANTNNNSYGDVIYLDTNDNGVYDSRTDTVLEVVDYKTYQNNEWNSVQVNLNSNYVTSLRVKLIRDNRSPVQNYQGNEALFYKELIVR